MCVQVHVHTHIHIDIYIEINILLPISSTWRHWVCLAGKQMNGNKNNKLQLHSECVHWRLLLCHFGTFTSLPSSRKTMELQALPTSLCNSLYSRAHQHNYLGILLRYEPWTISGVPLGRAGKNLFS